MAEKGEASSCEDTEQSICADGFIKKMEPLNFGSSKNVTSLITSGAGNDNISEIVPSLLPPEIITDILSRLPIKDIIRYKIVSKEWYAMTKDPHFADMHLRKSLCSAPHFILVPRGERFDVKTNLCFLNKEDGIWRGRDIPIKTLEEKFVKIVCSCHGFLCVASFQVDPLFVYNPISRECLELPMSDTVEGIGFISVGFGYDPINKKYKLVRFFTFFNDDGVQTHMKAEIITLGEASWRKLEVSNINFCNPTANAVFLDYALHWIIDKDGDESCAKILLFDLSSEKFRTIKIPTSIRRAIHFPLGAFLLNLGGSLALVEHSYWEEFQVWRLARVNTKTGYRFYGAFYRMTIPYKHSIHSIRLKDKLINNSFLFHVTCFREGPKKEINDHFALYDPEQADYRVLDASRMPEAFDSTLLIPSLVSPCAALGTTDQAVKFN